MNKNLLFLVFLIIAGHSSYCQDLMVPDTTVINKNWRDLVVALKSKTTVALRLTQALNGVQNVDRKQLNTSSTNARSLSDFIDTLRHNDSITINQLDLLNNNLTDAFSRTLATVQSNPRLSNQNNYIKMINELTNIDGRITYSKKSYNDLCLQFNRSDLIFGKGANPFSP